jgi:MiaB/RimO family radical SAM methylthiotransferase
MLRRHNTIRTSLNRITQQQITSNKSSIRTTTPLFQSRFHSNDSKGRLTEKPWLDGPSLSHFISTATSTTNTTDAVENSPSAHYLEQLYESKQVQKPRKQVYIETYGCQMNVSDTEIIYSVMKSAGYEQCNTFEEADVLFLNTCAIRENAESKVWRRLEYIKHLKQLKRFSTHSGKQPVVGVLGCMAERLKTKLLEKEKLVDIVAGPDAYRDLPRLIHVIDHEDQQHAVNVLLSADETYADISPTRVSSNNVSAFVTIMRGCDNMCSYCIVPFTRGRERSRPIESILDEVRTLSKQGFKEITLLGQNVNSYCDTDSQVEGSEGRGLNEDGTSALSNDGFKTIYKPKKGGIRFTELIDRVSQIDPEIRVRFTSPHPKDFPDDLLHLIRGRPNICNQLHLPAQSGSTEVLDRMRRGYSREAYLNLAGKVREIIPGVTISTDFISGFCGETDEQHKETISLMEQVQYEHAFLFAYSLREKTHAHRNYSDDVPEDIKQKRLSETIQIFRKYMLQKLGSQVGTTQLVLIDGTSRKSSSDLIGRTDGNMKVLFANSAIPMDQTIDQSEQLVNLQPGDYVEVKITGIVGQNLKAEPICKTSLTHYHNRYNNRTTMIY